MLFGRPLREIHWEFSKSFLSDSCDLGSSVSHFNILSILFSCLDQITSFLLRYFTYILPLFICFFLVEQDFKTDYCNYEGLWWFQSELTANMTRPGSPETNRKAPGAKQWCPSLNIVDQLPIKHIFLSKWWREISLYHPSIIFYTLDASRCHHRDET